jgi:hypothetical protein
MSDADQREELTYETATPEQVAQAGRGGRAVDPGASGAAAPAARAGLHRGVKDPAVHLVLDTSAVLAYVAGSIDVGELIAEVADEGRWVGVPAPCLVDAFRRSHLDDLAALRVLTRHPRCVVLPMLAEDWEPVAQRARALDRVDLALCLVEALERGGYVATAEPDAYGGTGDLPVIAV